jgi:hypothetical protein
MSRVEGLAAIFSSQAQLRQHLLRAFDELCRLRPQVQPLRNRAAALDGRTCGDRIDPALQVRQSINSHPRGYSLGFIAAKRSRT